MPPGGRTTRSHRVRCVNGTIGETCRDNTRPQRRTAPPLMKNSAIPWSTNASKSNHANVVLPLPLDWETGPNCRGTVTPLTTTTKLLVAAGPTWCVRASKAHTHTRKRQRKSRPRTHRDGVCDNNNSQTMQATVPRNANGSTGADEHNGNAQNALTRATRKRRRTAPLQQ